MKAPRQHARACSGTTLALCLMQAVLYLSADARGQCPREWASGFEVPGVVAEQLTAMAVYDDGNINFADINPFVELLSR